MNDMKPITLYYMIGTGRCGSSKLAEKMHKEYGVRFEFTQRTGTSPARGTKALDYEKYEDAEAVAINLAAIGGAENRLLPDYKFDYKSGDCHEAWKRATKFVRLCRESLAGHPRTGCIKTMGQALRCYDNLWGKFGVLPVIVVRDPAATVYSFMQREPWNTAAARYVCWFYLELYERLLGDEVPGFRGAPVFYSNALDRQWETADPPGGALPDPDDYDIETDEGNRAYIDAVERAQAAHRVEIPSQVDRAYRNIIDRWGINYDVPGALNGWF